MGQSESVEAQPMPPPPPTVSGGGKMSRRPTPMFPPGPPGPPGPSSLGLRLGGLSAGSSGGGGGGGGGSEEEEEPSSFARPLETTRYTRTESQLKADKLAASSGQCAEVTPFLFVSGREVAADEAALRRHGITHVVNCAGLHVPNFFEEQKKEREGGVTGEGRSAASTSSSSPPLRCQYLTLNMFDSKIGEDLTWFVYDVIAFVEEARKNGGKVLVHCIQGVSRSCSFCIAYLMWASSSSQSSSSSFSAALGFKEAFAFVKERRLVASPNVAFTCNLVEWAKLRSAAAGAGGAARLEPLLLRVAAHGAHDPSRLVVKVCRSEKDYRRTVKPAPDALDTRGVFIVLAPPNPAAATPADEAEADGGSSSSSSPCCFVWVGAAASAEAAAAAEVFIDDALVGAEGLTWASRRVLVRQHVEGQEQEQPEWALDFLKALGLLAEGEGGGGGGGGEAAAEEEEAEEEAAAAAAWAVLAAVGEVGAYFDLGASEAMQDAARRSGLPTQQQVTMQAAALMQPSREQQLGGGAGTGSGAGMGLGLSLGGVNEGVIEEDEEDEDDYDDYDEDEDDDGMMMSVAPASPPSAVPSSVPKLSLGLGVGGLGGGAGGSGGIPSLKLGGGLSKSNDSSAAEAPPNAARGARGGGGGDMLHRGRGPADDADEDESSKPHSDPADAQKPRLFILLSEDEDEDEDEDGGRVVPNWEEVEDFEEMDLVPSGLVCLLAPTGCGGADEEGGGEEEEAGGGSSNSNNSSSSSSRGAAGATAKATCFVWVGAECRLLPGDARDKPPQELLPLAKALVNHQHQQHQPGGSGSSGSSSSSTTNNNPLKAAIAATVYGLKPPPPPAAAAAAAASSSSARAPPPPGSSAAPEPDAISDAGPQPASVVWKIVHDGDESDAFWDVFNWDGDESSGGED